MPKSILVLRNRARGDVLLTTPVLARLKQDNPDSEIFVRTEYPEVLRRNPHIRYAGARIQMPWARTVNLEVAYEMMPQTHLIDAFAIGAGFKRGEIPRRISLYPSTNDHYFANEAVSSLNQRYAVIAPGPGLWKGRNWNAENWQIVIHDLRTSNFKVVLVGKAEGPEYFLNCDLDLRGKTTIGGLAAVLQRADLFVGIDSFPAHAAGAMKTPRVVLFGITRAEFILCDAPFTVPVESPMTHPYSGMRHCVQRISTCGNPPNNPMDTITPAQVITAIKQIHA